MYKAKDMLRHKVNFVVSNYAPFEELNQKSELLLKDLKPFFEQCLSLEDAWLTQTFIYLKLAGYQVNLTDRLVPNEICFVESSSLRIKQRSYRSYVIACRADRPRSILANQSTAMNRLAIKSSSEHHLYSWPQPIIKKRDQSRSTNVKNVDFKGNIRNLWEPFQTAEFSKALKDLGLTMKMSTEAELSGVDLYRSWGDYSTSDILLAVRNLTEYDFSIKPELKLTNAWRAGVPAILGPEPAYQALRKSPLDYIEVRSVDEAIRAITDLKTKPELYEAMVENGLSRSQEFSQESLTKQWSNLIEGPIFEGYEKWRDKSWLHTKTIRIGSFALDAMREKIEVKSHLKKVRNGPRPLTGLKNT